MTIYTSKFANVPELPRGNAIEFFLRSPHRAKYANDKQFTDSITGESLTVAESSDAIVKFGAILADKYGLKKGDVVAFSALNGIYNQAIHMGTILLGAILSPANIQYLPEELAHQIRIAQPKLLIAADFYLPAAQEAIKQSGANVQLIPQSQVVAEIKAALRDPNARRATAEPVDGWEHHAYYCFSSGTSGAAKGVISTHINLLSNVLQLETSADPVTLGHSPVGAVLPTSHIYGLNVFIWTSPFFGRHVITFPKFDLEQLLAATVQYKIGVLYLVPPIILLLGKHPLVEKYKAINDSLENIMSGAAPLSHSTIKLLERRIPKAYVAQGYGLTETSPITHVRGPDPNNEYNQDGVGWLMPNMEARLIDPATGKDVAIGERGELWLRGPNVMRGYLKNPTATAETLVEGDWLRTGDVAVIDKTGQYFIVDRIKELIKSKGHQVAPAELEAILISSDEVVDAAVIGVPDADGVTELPRAFVQLAPNADADKVVRWFNQKVSRHKRLWGGLVVVEAVPKSPSGKILRRFLRDRKGDKVIGESLAKL